MKILRHIFLLLIMTSIGAGVTYAVFSSQAKVKGAMFSTGKAELQLGKSSTGPWLPELTDLNFSNIIPGWSNDYHLFVKNTGSTTLKLKLSGGLTSGSDTCSLANEIKLRLNPWFDNSLTNLSGLGITGIALDQIAKDEVKELVLHFSMESTRTESTTTCTLTGYDFVFDGAAEPTIQPTP